MHSLLLYYQPTAIHILVLNFNFSTNLYTLNDSDGTREVHSIKSLFKHVSKGKKITAIAVCREYPLLYLTKQTDI